MGSGRRLMRATAERYGLPLWMSEMSLIGVPDDPSMAAALKIAHYMYQDFVEAGASAWIYCFTIFNADFPGSMGILAPPKGGELVIPKRFWAFANYSRFVRRGWNRMKVEGLSFASSGFESPEGDRFAIVALNASWLPRPTRYDFGSWTPSSVETFRTSKQMDLAAVPGTRVEGNVLSAQLAPLSVTTFSGKLEKGEAPGPCTVPEP